MPMNETLNTWCKSLRCLEIQVLMISFFGIQWYRCSRSSSNFVPNRIQQYNTVCMTNISDRVIIDIVMWFWWWPHKSGSEMAATVSSPMVSLCSTANNFPIGRSVCGLQKKAPHSLFHSPFWWEFLLIMLSHNVLPFVEKVLQLYSSAID